MLLQQPRQMQEHHVWPWNRARLGGSTTGCELPRGWQEHHVWPWCRARLGDSTTGCEMPRGRQKHALLQQPQRGQGHHAWPWSKVRQDDSTRRGTGQRLGLVRGLRALQRPRQQHASVWYKARRGGSTIGYELGLRSALQLPRRRRQPQGR